MRNPNELRGVERRMIWLTAQGYTTRQTAEQLCWANSAVCLSLSLLFQQFGVSCRRELVDEATRRGLPEIH